MADVLKYSKGLLGVLFHAIVHCVCSTSDKATGNATKEIGLTNMLLDFSKSVADNLGSEHFKEVLSYAKIQDFLNNKNPEKLNHDLENLFKNAAITAVGYIKIHFEKTIKKEVSENPTIENKELLKQLNQVTNYLEEQQNFLKSLDENVKLHDIQNHDNYLLEITNHVFFYSNSLPAELLEKLKAFYKDELPNCFALAYKEALRNPANEKGYKAFQILYLEEMAKTQSKNSEILSKIEDKIQWIKEEGNIIDYDILNRYYEDSFAKWIVEMQLSFANLRQFLLENFFNINEKLEQILRETKKSKNDRQPIKRILRNVKVNLPSKVLGRANDLYQIRSLIFNQKPIIISGEAGIGKTTLITLYWERFAEEYNHVAWITCKDGLTNGLVDLAFQLGLIQELEYIKEDKIKQEIILLSLINLSTPTLLIFDSINSISELEDINLAFSLSKIHVLITTRFQYNNNYVIAPLSQQNAYQLFRQYYSEDSKSFENNLAFFLKEVNYNPLCIEIFSKTLAKTSIIGQAMSQFITRFKEEKFKTLESQFKISTNYNNANNVTIYEVINSIYNFTNLTPFENSLLVRLSLLSSEKYNYEILTELICNEKHELFAEGLSNLVSKGWLTSNRKDYCLSNVVQNIILANTNSKELENSSFIIDRLKLVIDDTYKSVEEILTVYEPICQYVLNNWQFINPNFDDCFIELLTDLDYLNKKGLRVRSDLNSTYENLLTFIKFKEQVLEPSELLETYITFTGICERLQKFKKGYEYQLKVISVYETYEKQEKKLALANEFAGELCQSNGDYILALSHYKKAATYLEQLNQKDRYLLTIYNKTALCLIESNESHYIEEAEFIIHDLIHRIENHFEVYTNTYFLYNDAKNYQLNGLDSFLNDVKADLFNALALAHMKKNNLKLSEELYKKILVYYNKNNSSVIKKAMVENNLSLLYIVQGKKEKLKDAEKMLRSIISLKNFTNQNHIRIDLNAKVNLSILLRLLAGEENINQSLQLINSVLEEDIGSEILKLKVLLNKAITVWFQGEDLFAKELILECLSISSNLNSIDPLLLDYITKIKDEIDKSLLQNDQD